MRAVGLTAAMPGDTRKVTTMNESTIDRLARGMARYSQARMPVRRITAAVLVLAAMALAPFGEQPRAILLAFDPASSVVDEGGLTSVDLKVSGLGDFASPSVAAFDVTFIFDPLVLSLDFVQFHMDLGPFIPDVTAVSVVDNVTGIAFVTQAALVADDVINETQSPDITLATFMFRGLAPGESSELIIDTDPLVTILTSAGNGTGPAALDYDLAETPASVTVAEPTPIDLPSTLTLMLPGLLAVTVRRRPIRARR